MVDGEKEPQEETTETEEEYQKRRDETLWRLQNEFTVLDLEDVLVDLTDLDLDPSLIFDDNGKWACGRRWFGYILSEPGCDYQTTVVIPGDDFCDNPREAVKQFIQRCIDLDKKEKEKNDA